MSVSLCCPACGSEIGYANNSDGYKEKYYPSNKGEDGKIICSNCGNSKYSDFYPFKVVLTVFGAAITIGLILNLCFSN